MRFKDSIYLIVLFISGCKMSAQDQGIVMVRSYFPSEDSLTSNYNLGYRIFFMGNKSIQEVPLLLFATDTAGKQESQLKIKHYSFLDPSKDVSYNYSTFSDTARVLNKYNRIDSVRIEGGWNYLSNEKFEYDSLKNIADTTINNDTYKRIKLFKKFNGKNIYLVLYLDCNKNNFLITIFKNLSDSLGCAIMRDDTFFEGRHFMTRELIQISDTLSQKEVKVFDAWEKNIKKYPVN